MSPIVYRDRIVQWYIARDSGIVVDIVLNGCTSRPDDNRIGIWVSRSNSMCEVQASRIHWRRAGIAFVDFMD